ncbi:MAG: UDP-2,3-diacylglucosamine diphosphatase [Isosphaeraceae bacterium]
MPVYFASDMHLRLDRPDRGRRLAQWVKGLHPEDQLYLVGDVCDFWFGARQRTTDPLSCEGLRALAAFRDRGGSLIVLPGNHDLWLGPFYESTLGATFVQEPLRIETHGLKIHVVHGHRAGGRQPWKAVMESQAFFQAFQKLPAPLADRLDQKLDESNTKDRARDEDRLLGHFRKYVARLTEALDLAVFGHVHGPVDDTTVHPRLVVLGGWHHGGSYLRIDDEGATHVRPRF